MLKINNLQARLQKGKWCSFEKKKLKMNGINWLFGNLRLSIRIARETEGSVRVAEATNDLWHIELFSAFWILDRKDCERQHRTVYPFVNFFCEWESSWGHFGIKIHLTVEKKKKLTSAEHRLLHRHSGQLFPVAVILCHKKKGHAEWHPHPGLYIVVYATGEMWQFWPGSRDTDCGLVQSVSLQVNGAIHHVKLSDKAAANESIESFPRLFFLLWAEV